MPGGPCEHRSHGRLGVVPVHGGGALVRARRHAVAEDDPAARLATFRRFGLLPGHLDELARRGTGTSTDATLRSTTPVASTRTSPSASSRRTAPTRPCSVSTISV